MDSRGVYVNFGIIGNIIIGVIIIGVVINARVAPTVKSIILSVEFVIIMGPLRIIVPSPIRVRGMSRGHQILL